MKRILRNYTIDSFSLYLTSLIAAGIVFQKGIETLLLAGLGLTITFHLIKPVINILLLPLNLITFNLFKWISSAIALYLVTLLVPGFRITKFLFSGLRTEWFDLPSLDFQGILAYISFSLLLSLISTFIYWLVK